MNLGAIIWLVLFILFLYMEANTVALVSLWFAGGALAAMVAALLKAVPIVQIILFIGVSAILLTLLRPILKKYFTPKLKKTNIDAIVGSKGIVLAEIDNDLSQGKVKLGGMEWTARSTSGEKLTAGRKIVVDRIEGVKVFVSPAEEKEQMYIE